MTRQRRGRRRRAGATAVEYVGVMIILVPLVIAFTIQAAALCGLVHHLIASVVGLSLM